MKKDPVRIDGKILGVVLIFLAGCVIGAVGAVIFLLAISSQKPSASGPVRPVVPAGPPGAATAPAAPPAPARPRTPQPLPQAVPGASTADIQGLATRRLLLPIAGVAPRDLRDSFHDARAGHRHEAIDILAPEGRPVTAIDDGMIVKLFTSKPGGLTIYQFDPSQTYSYYYAHLSQYAPGLTENMPVKKGQLIGFVGHTGDADGGVPHLHFAINRLLPGKHWWQGTPIDPYPFLATSIAR